MAHTYSMSIVSPSQNKKHCKVFQIEEYAQCLLTTSAGLSFPGIKTKSMNPDAIALQTQWNDSALWRLWSLECGMEEELTTDSLSPNM